MTACSEAGDGRGVALVAGTLVATLEKLGKITGEIATIASNVNITNNVAIVNSPAFAKAVWEIYLGRNSVGEGVKTGLTSRL